jgi:NTP pyrophosphatase (non-canonical NTP hydrolase)
MPDDTGPTDPAPTTLAAFQQQMVDLYGERDAERGLARSFAWFAEEVGELSRALFRGSPEDRLHEVADVLAWLASLAAQAGVDLEAAARRYADGCPRCGAVPCYCPTVR